MREIALISAYKKDGLTSLARALQQRGMELVATGNSRKVLQDEGIDVMDITDLTGEPERFGGRVKTLHHKVMGGILFRPGQDESEWPEDFRIAAVVCNFYPLEEKARDCKNMDELMEWVDIGGPTMVRAAAKNHKHVFVFTHAEQYSRYIAVDPSDHGALRRRMALEAFEMVRILDESVQFYFAQMQLEGVQSGSLKYGENPHQPASFLPNFKAGLLTWGHLSYNNIRDAEAALRFVRPFKSPAVSVVKHQTLCGAAVGTSRADEKDVFEEAWEGDTVSRFGSIIAFNHTPPKTVVDEVLKKKFIEVLVMPRTEETEALAHELHTAKERLRFVLVDQRFFGQIYESTENVEGLLGRIYQKSDDIPITGDESLEDLWGKAGQWMAACSKSNAIALVSKLEKTQVLALAGAGQGQPNRVEALRDLAIPRAKSFCERRHTSFTELLCVSDAFIPFTDTVEILHKEGIRRLVQPGGSKADEEIQAFADKQGITMELTGVRHFWH